MSQDPQACIKKVIYPLQEEPGWWSHLVERRSEAAAPDDYLHIKQVAFGGACGWCAGFLLQKYGRVVATAAGGGLLLLQAARRSGYVTVDWSKLETDANKVTPELQSLADVSREFVKENMVLTSGFVGGLLLGLAA